MSANIMKKVLRPFKGAINAVLFISNLLFWFIPFGIVILLKIALPFAYWRNLMTSLLDELGLLWIKGNSLLMDLCLDLKWDVQFDEEPSTKNWYLVLSNHQTWVDIPVLQRVLWYKAPMIKFFLKQELRKVPILGVCWWALDFPFTQRYSAEFLEKNPHLKGKDMEATRIACEKFKFRPVSVMNFVEGTRFTYEKHADQQSPYSNLLRPKAGGTGFALSAMNEQLTHILNITIAYPGVNDKGMWSFLCGDFSTVRVRVETIPIDDNLRGDYTMDENFRARFQTWINQIWQAKNDLLKQLYRA